MNSARDALVGVVIIGAVVIGFVGTLWLQGYAWGAEQRELYAVLEEVGQLRSGAPVKVRGVRVGRVREIAMAPGGERVRLRMRIAEGVVLPDDPVVILSPESMFGDWQAEIYPRGRFEHARYPDVEAEGGDVLPGYALPDITQLTAEAAMIAENIAVLTDRIGIAFSEETAQNIATLIDNVENVSEGLAELVAQQGESFSRLTAEFEEAAQGINVAARQADQTLRTAQGTFERVDGILARDEVDDFLTNLAELTANLDTLAGDVQGTNQEVRRTVARIDSTFVRVAGVLRLVEEGEGTLARLLHDPSAIAELEGTLVQLQALLADIRENPRRYLRLSIF